jgi:phage gp46-like protein
MERLMGFVGETSEVNIKIFSDPDEALQWLVQGCDADLIQTLSKIP